MSCAATLSVLALNAKAAVVYTSVKEIGEGQNGRDAVASIDLNGDGKIDFDILGHFESIQVTSFIYRQAAVYAGAEAGNQIAVVSTFAGIGIAQALNFGQEVGPDLRFSNAIRHTFRLGEVASIGSGPRSGVGQFYRKANKFVALKFAFAGNTYYGWARVSTQLQGNKLAFELVDYAYQSTPNLPILAGQGIPKPESDLLRYAGNPPLGPQTTQAERKPQPATLGLLAYGAKALPLWRRPLNSGADAVR